MGKILHRRQKTARRSYVNLVSFEAKVVAVLVACAIVLSLVLSLVLRRGMLSVLASILGFAYILFIPGYVFVRSFLHHHDPVEKIALSFGMSILFVIAALMFSNLVLRISISPTANFLIIFVVIALILAVKMFERHICRALNLKRKDLVID